LAHISEQVCLSHEGGTPLVGAVQKADSLVSAA